MSEATPPSVFDGVPNDGVPNDGVPPRALPGGISIRDLTVRVEGRPLLEGASADFPAGEVTLVIGASGAGKTVLMKILAGLLGPDDRRFEIRGSIRIDGTEVVGRGGVHAVEGGARRRRPQTGIVFQDAALFDELSAADNVRFAADHRATRSIRSMRAGADAATAHPPPPSPPLPTAEGFLEEFGVPRGVPVSALSGGQRQRLAIARTLAFDPPVIIYDEPTTGLDPVNARRVADRILSTCKAHEKTSVVVTHDYEHLADVAAAIYLLDPRRRLLVPLAAGDLEELSRTLPGAVDETREAQAEEGPEGVPRARGAATAVRLLRGGWRALRRSVDRCGSLLEATGAAAEALLASLVFLVPLWRSARWGVRYFLHYLRLVASPSAWLYFGASGAIAGFVSTHFVFEFLPHRQYIEPLVADEILNGLGFALYRILIPVLLTILVAARCGAAVAADVGNRVWGHQIDAMRSMAASPRRYLLTGILWAFVVGAPLLVGIGFLAARTTSLAVFAFNFPEKGPDYWDGNFHRDLRIPGEILYRGTAWLLAKVLVCGLGTALITYHVGIGEKESGVEVARGITTTIIAATLFVLLVHFAFAFLEF